MVIQCKAVCGLEIVGHLCHHPAHTLVLPVDGARSLAIKAHIVIGMSGCRRRCPTREPCWRQAYRPF